MKRIFIKRIKTSKNQFGQGYKYYLRCLNCLKVFSISSGFFNNGQGKFCSRQCSSEFRKKKGHIEKKCLECGKKFEVNKCYLKRGGGKYCSLKCYHISQKGKSTWNEHLTKKNDIRLEKLSQKHKGKHYSKKTEFRKGLIPWNFNNYSSFQPYKPTFNKQKKEQCRNLYFNYCQLCGIVQECLEKKLIIHHIDYNKENDKLNNWIPLCPKCHSKTNSNNRQFWTEFFKKKTII